MRRLVLALVVAACAAAPTPASAAVTYYVNQSTPGASNSNACTAPAQPCLTIQAAIDKAKTSAGNTVTVLPDPNGFTDTYAETLILNGPNPVTLEGAGTGAGGTNVPGPTSDNNGITATGGSIVRNLHVTGGLHNALFIGFQSAAENVVADHATDTGAFVAGGVLRDSSVSAPTGVRLDINARVVRSRITATSAGVGPVNVPGAGGQPGINGSIYDSVISGPAGAGTGLDMKYGGYMNQTVRLRHVTFIGFATRVSVASTGGPTSIGVNVLEAVNSTFAGPAGTIDLSVGNDEAKASLININRSPARTSKGTGTIEELNPLDVDPMLSADGHLLPGSPLIDAGTTAGFLAGDAEDTMDVDREPRLLGAAPDVGADELPPPPPPPGGDGPDVTAPAMSSLRVPKRFRSRCPKPKPRGCRAGMTLKVTLSEAATVELLFKRIARRRAKGSARPLRARLAAKAGANRLRFSGRIRRRPLRRGRYRLSITAVDAAGNRSPAAKRVVRVL
jgi:hypothetical protein